MRYKFGENCKPPEGEGKTKITSTGFCRKEKQERKNILPDEKTPPTGARTADLLLLLKQKVHLAILLELQGCIVFLTRAGGGEVPDQAGFAFQQQFLHLLLC